MKTKQSYINSLEPEQLIAFKHGDRLISAKVAEVNREADEVISVFVVTKNGSRYIVKPEDISWVKTGSRWPAGIYNALKMNRKDVKNGETEVDKQQSGESTQ